MTTTSTTQSRNPGAGARVQDIMNQPVFCLSPDESVREAAAALGRRGVSGAPVCDAHGRVLGVVSRGDLAEAWLAERPGAPSCVADVMSREVVTALPGEGVEELARRMVFEGVHRVVVVDEAGTAVGLVTPLDVLRAVVAAGPVAARPPERSRAHFPSWPAGRDG